MMTCGIDVGSKNVKVVLLKDDAVIGRINQIVEMDRKASARDALDACLDHAGVSHLDLAFILATGSGQKSVDFASDNSTSIVCAAKAISAVDSSIKTVIDVGANDARAIRCDEGGKVIDFCVNEKCAAGAGAFVEAMSRAMELSLAEFAEYSLKSTKEIHINAQCAIFAESEVVSLIHEETDRGDICKAVHDAMAERIVSMARRVQIEEQVALVGGVAYNRGMLAALKAKLEMDIVVPEYPEYIGAYGAARLADEKSRQ